MELSEAILFYVVTLQTIIMFFLFSTMAKLSFVEKIIGTLKDPEKTFKQMMQNIQPVFIGPDGVPIQQPLLQVPIKNPLTG